MLNLVNLIYCCSSCRSVLSKMIEPLNSPFKSTFYFHFLKLLKICKNNRECFRKISGMGKKLSVSFFACISTERKKKCLLYKKISRYMGVGKETAGAEGFFNTVCMWALLWSFFTNFRSFFYTFIWSESLSENLLRNSS